MGSFENEGIRKSDESKFFLLTTAAEIVTTFGQIGTALSNLRLAM
jgi:hypothetical protein